jgi:uncharacterized protein YkwD
LKHLSLFTLLILTIVSTKIHSQSLSVEEKKLYDLIMDYRKQNGLPAIKLSKSLTFVAQTHVNDLGKNNPDQGICNLHSWSSNGNWKPCCYTDDHKKAKLMWSKPSELTNYSGNGYEIAYKSSDEATAIGAINAWKSSMGHNDVILNQNIWSSNAWKSIGIGIYSNYAVVWFGKENDY